MRSEQKSLLTALRFIFGMWTHVMIHDERLLHGLWNDPALRMLKGFDVPSMCYCVQTCSCSLKLGTLAD